MWIDSVLQAEYTYDDQGNRLNDGAQYDDQDRLTENAQYDFEYTANGELEKRTDKATQAETLYTHDGFGSLTGVALPDGRSIQYLIDAQGRRVGKKVNGALAWGLLYRSALQPVAEVDAAGAVGTRFVYATSRNIPDYAERGGTRYAIITDQLGSLRLVVDTSSGAVVQRMEYDAWGRVIVDTYATGWTRLPFGFAGGIFDRDTGLVRFGARDYDPGVGRWTSKEPLGFAGSDNFYAYAEGDPIGGVDPSGLAVEGPSRSTLTLLATLMGVGSTADLINSYHAGVDAAARGDAGGMDCAAGAIKAAAAGAVFETAFLAATSAMTAVAGFKQLGGMSMAEAKTLVRSWSKSTYPSKAASIRDHAARHGFGNDIAKYLRKAANFNKKGAHRTPLPDGAVRWNRKNGEFLIERGGEIVSYGAQ